MPGKKGGAKSKKNKDEAEPEGPEVLSGCYMFPNGDRYEGELTKLPGGIMERSGFGTHTCNDGTRYHGQWKDDQMWGQGELTFSSGDKYVGEFLNNKFHGKGIYIWSDDAKLTGTFCDNKSDGDGEYTDRNGQLWCGHLGRNNACSLRHKILSSGFSV